MAPGSWPALRRFFASILRFWAKQERMKAMNASAGTWSSANRGAMVRRSTVECTWGGGEKASGGRVISFSTRAYICVVTDRMP